MIVPYGNTPGDGLHFQYGDKVYKSLVTDAMAQGAASRTRARTNSENRMNNMSRRVSFGAQHGQGQTAAGLGSGTSTPTGAKTQSSLRNGQELPKGGKATAAIAVPSASGHGSSQLRRSEESDTSISSLGRSLPTPRTSPPMRPEE